MDGRELGRWAEEVAARDLERRGYRVLARNVRLQRGELDLVAARDGRLWFVEVKCRSRRDRGAPFLAVDRRKRRHLYAAAREYLHRRRAGPDYGFEPDYGFLVASVLPAVDAGAPCVSVSVLPISWDPGTSRD